MSENKNDKQEKKIIIVSIFHAFPHLQEKIQYVYFYYFFLFSALFFFSCLSVYAKYKVKNLKHFKPFFVSENEKKTSRIFQLKIMHQFQQILTKFLSQKFHRVLNLIFPLNLSGNLSIYLGKFKKILRSIFNSVLFLSFFPSIHTIANCQTHKISNGFPMEVYFVRVCL